MSGTEFQIAPGHLAKQIQTSVEKHTKMLLQPNLITREESLQEQGSAKRQMAETAPQVPVIELAPVDVSSYA